MGEYFRKLEPFRGSHTNTHTHTHAHIKHSIILEVVFIITVVLVQQITQLGSITLVFNNKKIIDY